MQRERHRIRDLVLIFYLVGMLFFIWGNSMASAELSSSASGGLQDTLLALFPWIKKTNFLFFCVKNLRKVMHFTEFFLLAVGALAFFLHRGLFSFYRLGFLLFLGPAVAFIDEGLQLFTEGRASSLLDVGIDTCGYYSCLILYLILWFPFQKMKERRRRP